MVVTLFFDFGYTVIGKEVNYEIMVDCQEQYEEKKE